jgi:hypothetical protein
VASHTIIVPEWLAPFLHVTWLEREEIRYMMQFQKLVVTFMIVALMSCANIKGPTVVKVYDQSFSRNEIAVVRLAQKSSFRILQCDGITVPMSIRYLLVRPGRHELTFSISGATLLGSVYEMHNKKFLDVEGGHTYILKSETGLFFVGDKWFPEVVDVTDNQSLHVSSIPVEEVHHIVNK